MREELLIILDKIPPSLNRFAGRENSWGYRSAKAAWTKLVYAMALRERRRKKLDGPPPEYADVEIRYFFPNKRRHDPDNYAGKFLLDGLTKAGAIRDDDFEHIRLALGGDYDKTQPRTEIRVSWTGSE